MISTMLKLLLCFLATTNAFHLLLASSPSGPSGGPAPPASEESASGAAAVTPSNDGSEIQNTLLKLADQMEGKDVDSKHKQLANAIVQSTKILGTHHATKVTLQQVVNALKSMKEEKDDQKQKTPLPVAAIINALRVPPLQKKKKKKADLKKLLGTAVNAVEGKLNQLDALLAEQATKEITGDANDMVTAKVEKSVEELNGLDIISGLEQLTPESELPKGMVVIPTRRGETVEE